MPDTDIAMWGPRSSGKTTFLAALRSALTQEGGGWNMWADDDASEELLTSSVLTGRRAFPEATQGIDVFNWTLTGTVPRTVKKGRFGSETIDQQVRIGLKLADPSGELANPDQARLPLRRKLVEHLAGSRGIIFMFDPIREFEEGDAFDATDGLLVQLARAVSDHPDSGARLPHYVAVCVTKFDDLRVFDAARSAVKLTRDPDDKFEFPRVPEDDAEHLLSRLCEVSRTGNAEMLPQLFRQYFYRQRVKYFITSSVGFYVTPRTNKFDSDDPENLWEDERGKPRIRGPIHPINVVEPIRWLSEKTSGAYR